MKKEPKIQGKLKIGSNCCTDPIKIHPIRSDSWVLRLDDMSGKRANPGFASLILFNKKQIWEAYYFRFADQQGWTVERPGICLRMPEKDFEKYFGKYEILGRDS